MLELCDSFGEIKQGDTYISIQRLWAKHKQNRVTVECLGGQGQHSRVDSLRFQTRLSLEYEWGWEVLQQKEWIVC